MKLVSHQSSATVAFNANENAFAEVIGGEDLIRQAFRYETPNGFRSQRSRVKSPSVWIKAGDICMGQPAGFFYERD